MIRIICGANAQELEDVAGKTLGEVKSQLTDVLNIPPQARAIVGGETVGDDHVLEEGTQIEFVKPAGDKG